MLKKCLQSAFLSVVAAGFVLAPIGEAKALSLGGLVPTLAQVFNIARRQVLNAAPPGPTRGLALDILGLGQGTILGLLGGGDD